MFVMYIVADACWLYFEPEAIPSLHAVIYFHHVVTFLLLLFPLKHPQFSSFTCLDGERAVLFLSVALCTAAVAATDSGLCRAYGAEYVLHDSPQMLGVATSPHASVLLAELCPSQVS